jgi:ABC-type glycerol-3-phosphate transport system substrate-binding protein
VSKSKIRIINIILCVAILATLTIACNKSDDKDNKGQETTKTATEPVDSKPARPEVLEITRCLYFGDATDNPDLKEEFMKEFENKTGQKLKVNAIPRNGYMEKINLMLTSGELKGMVSIFGPNDVMKAMEDGVAEPFDDYLKDNANWNKLSQEYRESFKFDDKIYGVNGGYTGNFFTRTLRKDWLDNLGLDVPETVDDLFEVAKAFTENDPDKNGKDDTGGLTAAGTWNLGDIFQAFDARLDNTSSGSITWDAKEGVWIDSMLKPEMIDALKYLKKLYDNKYLDNEFLTNKGNNMREKIYTGKFGSTFYWSMFGYTTCRNEMAKNFPEAKMVEVPELDKPATLNSGVFVFRTTSKLLPTFLYRVLLSSIFREFIDTLSAGSTIKHLYQKDLKNFEFRIPLDIEEQQAIADVLTAMDEEIEALEKEKAKIESIKEGAMYDLLTGRVRL